MSSLALMIIILKMIKISKTATLEDRKMRGGGENNLGEVGDGSILQELSG